MISLMNHRAVLAETDLFVRSKIFILLTSIFLSSTQILDDVNTFGLSLQTIIPASGLNR